MILALLERPAMVAQNPLSTQSKFVAAGFERTVVNVVAAVM
jgi:hypothetical protein